MPFIPHTEKDTKAMLDCIGVDDMEQLFEEIPSEFRCQPLDTIPDGMTELELKQFLTERLADIQNGSCFIGAGAYEHHIPAAVWEIVSRGEYLTAYTPYQAEASQGTLQLLYEFQSMMGSLTGMEVSNSSLYDGASALAESVLMAVRSKKSKSKAIVLASGLHPHYRDTVNSIVCNQNIELLECPIDEKTGLANLANVASDLDVAAVVVQQPNFYGLLDDVDSLANWAKQKSALLIACVNPTSLALLKSPAQWGEDGADIVCGEGQPLGVPLASGGPYFGFLCCKQKWVRQMPGRLVGRTVDADGKQGFSLTLQAREQHIRRSKATSNICTNQGLLVTAATIYMSLLGADGLSQVAKSCHLNAVKLAKMLSAIDGVSLAFDGPYFHEFVLTLTKPVDKVLAYMNEQGILGGYALNQDELAFENGLLVCVTETKTEADLNNYAAILSDAMTKV